ncbi:hypothetical protein H5410_060671 [Solanum commersonii]|uniref:Uncharacterized protein n=1 Tax=Solanum commersonii TaxID=4109 RepID=A0A9J5W639_SOLCO|nr:hypothetical protein H5410_060671 [Solanum commersonii]
MYLQSTTCQSNSNDFGFALAAKCRYNGQQSNTDRKQANVSEFPQNFLGVSLQEQPNKMKVALNCEDCVGAIDGTYIEGEVLKRCNKHIVIAKEERIAHDSKVLENALVEPTSQFPFLPHVLPNYLREYQSTDELFMVYENENIVADNIDQQMAQINNVGSSSRSHDREMQVQHEKIVRTMWDDYIKD